MVRKSAQTSVWEKFTISFDDDITPEEAEVFVRLLNRPEGQAYLHRVADSLTRLRRATKRKRYRAANEPVVDPSSLPYLLTVEEAAGLLRTSVDAVYARVERGQLTGVEGLIREGTKLLIHRDKLLRSLERSADGRRGGRR